MSDTKLTADSSENKQPTLRLSNTPEYRDGYANSVQVRMSVWDFHLAFGTMHQHTPDEVNVENFQGIYVSPQQAKALWNVLGHNLAQYEQTFGELALEPLPTPPPGSPVH
jgi:hypothetical protein